MNFETLEPRHHAAGLAAITVDAPPCVYVGQTFQIEIRAEELLSSRHGLGTVSTDVTWDRSVIQLRDVAFSDSLPSLRSVAQHGGKLSDLTASGFYAFGGRPIGDQTAEVFATLTFEAVGPGQVEVGTAQSEGRTIARPVAILDGRVEYDSAVVDVVLATEESLCPE